MIVGRSPILPLALALAITGCTTPFAGVYPAGAILPGGVPFAGVYPSGGDVQPAKTPAPAPASTPRPVSTPTPSAAVRLSGVVLFNDTPVADAQLSAVDLATDRALPLISAGGQNYRVAQGANPQTDAQGRFNCELPPLRPGQLVKLQATRGNQTFLALFDHTGRAVGQETAAPASYSLKQTTLTVSLRLTLGSTVLVNAFEGVFRLQLRRTGGDVATAVASLIARVQEVAADLETQINAQPELANKLVATLANDGNVAALETFRTTLEELGFAERLREVVRTELAELSRVGIDTDPDLPALNAEQFPLDVVAISQSGAITVGTGQTAVTIGVTVTTGRGGGGSSATPTPTPTPVARQLRPSVITGTIRVWNGSAYVAAPGAVVELRRATTDSQTINTGGSVQIFPPSFEDAEPAGTYTSEADGFYYFDNLSAGGYFVRVAPAANPTAFGQPRYVSFATGGLSGVDFAVSGGATAYRVE